MQTETVAIRAYYFYWLVINRSSRYVKRMMGTVGYFLNVLPVRIIVDQSEQFDAVAGRSFNATLAALTHSQASLDSIIDRLGITRSTSHQHSQTAGIIPNGVDMYAQWYV